MKTTLKKDIIVFRIIFILAALAVVFICIDNAFSQSASTSTKHSGAADQTKDRLIIGQIEPVMIKAAELTLPARIDTGATTSSLDARDIQAFERDGKKWMRFSVIDRRSNQKKQVEGPMTRMVIITSHGAESETRPAVKLKAVLGEVELLREFTLTDRSSFTYPVLIGRNFLEGLFIVDVTRKNTTAPMSEDAK